MTVTATATDTCRRSPARRGDVGRDQHDPGRAPHLAILVAAVSVALSPATNNMDGDNTMDDFMRVLIAADARQYGPGGSFADPEDQKLVGVPLGSLALEYLIGSNVLAFGGMVGIAGPPGSYKSALAMAFANRVLMQDGVAVRADTEGGKISADIVKGILGAKVDRCLIRNCGSVEEAQQFVSRMVQVVEERAADGTPPVALVIDSLAGSAAAINNRRISFYGHAGLGGPYEHRLWDEFFDNMAVRLPFIPAVLIFTNHVHRVVGGARGEVRHPCGDGQEAHASAYLHTRRLGSVETPGRVVTEVELTNVKSDCGAAGRRITVPFVFDQEAGVLDFNWAEATARLLIINEHLTYAEQRDPKRRPPPRRQDVIDVSASGHRRDPLGRRYTCGRLGLSGVTAAELCAAIAADDQVRDEIRSSLNIELHRAWAGRMPNHSTHVEIEERDAVQRGMAGGDRARGPSAAMYRGRAAHDESDLALGR